MSGHTYIFEEIEILVYGSGRQNLNLVPKIRFPLMVLIGVFFMLIQTFLKLLAKYQLNIILFGVITHFTYREGKGINV